MIYLNLISNVYDFRKWTMVHWSIAYTFHRNNRTLENTSPKWINEIKMPRNSSLEPWKVCHVRVWSQDMGSISVHNREPDRRRDNFKGFCVPLTTTPPEENEKSVAVSTNLAVGGSPGMVTISLLVGLDKFPMGDMRRRSIPGDTKVKLTKLLPALMFSSGPYQEKPVTGPKPPGLSKTFSGT